MKKYIPILLLAIALYWCLKGNMPQSFTKEDAPATQFSTERALNHLKEIAKNPHYVSAEDHKNVRNYIVKQLEQLGLTVEIQERVSVNKKWKVGATIYNIIAKIKGTNPNAKSLLLLSHYDSAPSSSLGGSDAGSGVVTIIEGVRAFLANNTQPENDIIIVLSDAEELGLLGAHAFVKYHKWAKNIGIILNFEARGSGGPSYMLLETNGGNSNLIKAFKNANVEYPVANSLLYSIYKMLPNDTDLTSFREEGDIDGFNFAFIDDHFDYHTAQDTYQRLDKNTLEHQGSYLMPLLNYFAFSDLSNLKSTTDDIYFNVPFFGLVSYPFSWIIPMLVVTSILFFVVLFLGFKSKKLKPKAVLKGFLPLLGALIISALLTHYLWKFLKVIHPQYTDILHGFTYNGHWYMLAFFTLAVAIYFWCYKSFFKTEQAANMLVAPIVLWLIVTALISLMLKGGAYFIFTGIFGVISMYILLFTNLKDENKSLVIGLLSIPVFVIVMPVVLLLPVGLGLGANYISVLFLVLMLALLFPIFSSFRSNLLAYTLPLLSLLCFCVASFTSGYSVNNKQPNSINYVLNSDQNEAYWASYNTTTDSFTEQFLGASPSTPDTFKQTSTSSKYQSKYKLYNKAEVKPVAPPKITIKDTIINTTRKINVSIIPQRKANNIVVFADTHIDSLIVNNESLKIKKPKLAIKPSVPDYRQILSYYLTEKDTVLNLSFNINSKAKLPKMYIKEASFDLLTNPNFKITPRNEIMMPTPFVTNDAIIVEKQIPLE